MFLGIAPFFTNDAVVLGILIVVLALIFHTSHLDSPGWKKFYTFVPSLLLAYFIPALLHWPFGLIAAHWYGDGLYDLLNQYNVVLPDGLSYDGINSFLETKSIPSDHFKFISSGFDLLTQHNLTFPSGLSYDEFQSYLEASSIPADSYKSLHGVSKMLAENNINLPAGLNNEDAINFIQSNNLIESEYKALQKHSQLYFVASRYLLPASLILLCLGIDLKALKNLGKKPLIMFLAATTGIVIGGPIALLLVSAVAPDVIGGSSDDIWRGFSTVAGSWIGGGANQTAMKEIFEVKDNLFGTMIVIDVIVANIWMGFLLYGANVSDKVDRWLKADNTAIEDLKNKIADYRSSISEMPTTTTLFILLAFAFGGVALSHWLADTMTPIFNDYNASTIAQIGTDEYGRPKNSPGVLVEKGASSLMSHFFWLIVVSTSFGLILSFTKARKMEGVGASRWGSIFIYVLVVTIGMKMNLGEVFQNLGLFSVGIIWMLVHVIILLLVAKLIKAPFFFVAVGSQANIGGAASAPIVASAFSPSLAPVGVLMAVLGYALGTYGALICAKLMEIVSG